MYLPSPNVCSFVCTPHPLMVNCLFVHMYVPPISMYKILRWFGGVGFKGADRRYKTGLAEGPKIATGRPSPMCNKRRRSRSLLLAAIFGSSAHPVLYLWSAPLNPIPPNHLKILYIEIGGMYIRTNKQLSIKGGRIYKRTNIWVGMFKWTNEH